MNGVLLHVLLDGLLFYCISFEGYSISYVQLSRVFGGGQIVASMQLQILFLHLLGSLLPLVRIYFI